MKLEELVGKKLTEAQFDEAAGKKDACYHKVKARYDVWPSAYASGALVKCRKAGAANWGNKSKKEGVYEKNKGKTLYGKDLVNYFVKRFKYSTRDATAVANKLKDVGFKVPKVLPKYESVKEGVDKFKKLPGKVVAKRMMSIKSLKPYASMIAKKKSVSTIDLERELPYDKVSVKDIDKVMKESVNEAKNTNVEWNNFEKAFGDFFTTVIRLGKANTKLTGDKADEKIFIKNFNKDVGKFYSLMQSWVRGQNESVNEGVNEGPQKDRNELALHMIELNKMLSNAKILAKKDPKAKRYIKLLQQDIKDAKNKMAKIKNESIEESYDIWNEDGSFGYTMSGLLPEAEYQGRKVKLGKPMQGDTKKFKVYVKNDKGNVVKVNFGQGGDAKGGTMRIRKSNPKARKSFRARHNCDSPGPRHKARYWSCRKW